MARKPDPKAAAEKRKKLIAIVGALLLAGLLAIQVPRTMKMLNRAPSTAPAAETAPAAAPATAAPAAATPGAAAPAAAAVLVDTDVAPAPADGQLVSFGRFRSKDPFAQQVDDAAAGEAAPERPAPAGGTPAPASQAGGGGAVSGGDAPPAPSSAGGPAPREAGNPAPATPTRATISVNGAAEEVTAESDFPAVEPIFTLVSIGKSSVKLAIAGGSYSTGAETVTLALGKSVTLMNTADGARYELKLVALA
jgi:hypothetical protein